VTSVPIEAICDTDVLPAMTGATHRLVLATSEKSPGRQKITDEELFGAEAEIQAAFDALGALLGRINTKRNGPVRAV